MAAVAVDLLLPNNAMPRMHMRRVAHGPPKGRHYYIGG